MKKVIKAIKIHVLSRLAAILIVLVYKTLKWKFVNYEQLSKDRPAVFAFWHGRILMLPGIYKTEGKKRTGRPICILISQHGDGRLIAKAVRMLGIDSVEGSSTRGGVKGMLSLIEKIKAGSDIGITPDGPRGPVWEVKPGVILVAQQTGLPIIPATYSAKSFWTFGSWDKMILPKPFSKAVAILGDPIFVEKDLDESKFEAVRLNLQDKMIQLTQQADNYDFNA